jgi:hypothetical protein
VANTKVVPNIQIYLHTKFHIFLRSLSIFPRFIFHPCVIGKFLEKEKEIFLHGPLLPHRPSPQRTASPAPVPSLPVVAMWSPLPRRSHLSASPLSAWPYLSGAFSPQIPPAARTCAAIAGNPLLLCLVLSPGTYHDCARANATYVHAILGRLVPSHWIVVLPPSRHYDAGTKRSAMIFPCTACPASSAAAAKGVLFRPPPSSAFMHT